MLEKVGATWIWGSLICLPIRASGGLVFPIWLDVIMLGGIACFFMGFIVMLFSGGSKAWPE